MYVHIAIRNKGIVIKIGAFRKNSYNSFVNQLEIAKNFIHRKTKLKEMLASIVVPYPKGNYILIAVLSTINFD